MRVLAEPTHVFRCEHCKATCEADISDFKPNPHKDIIWDVKCGYCSLTNTMSVPALVSMKVASMFPGR